MYIILRRAKKNVGDFLIVERGKKILETLRPEHKLEELDSWRPLDLYLDKINEAAAVIICGGPGYQPRFYPKIYPLVKDLNRIKPPIIPLGLGWMGFPGDEITLRRFKFTSTSMKVLTKIHKENEVTSCRDCLTKEVLRKHGFTNVVVTGCPALYDIDKIGKPFDIPSRIQKIVFTPAQNPLYNNQSKEVMKKLKEIFPYSDRYCVFHRGLKADENTSIRDAENANDLRNEALKQDYEVVNAAYNIKNIEFYRECDLHVGYRLHGHIYFLSQRKPSFLLHEDGRGRGFSETFSSKGIDAWKRVKIGTIFEGIPSSKLHRAIKRFGLYIKPNKYAISILERYIREEIDNDFPQFRVLDRIIDQHYKRMFDFVKSLP